MQTIEIRNSIILSVQRALLGEVSPALRGVTVGWNDKSINILCYFDGFISKEDREAMSCVETEVMADFPDLQIDLDVIQCDVPQEMNLLDVWVYRRREALAKLTNMPVFKQFKFSGILKQANANDEFPINIDNAVIYCYANGLVMLECNPITVRKINEKISIDQGEKYSYKQTEMARSSEQQLSQEENDSKKFLLPFQFEGLEKVLINHGYEGTYQIEGKTPEGWDVLAEVYKYNISISFSNNLLYETLHQDAGKSFIGLSNLFIDYSPSLKKEESNLLEITYGIVDLPLRVPFVTSFLNSQAELSANPIRIEEAKNLIDAVLTAEIKFKKPVDEVINYEYENYYTWFNLILSFASGHTTESIYQLKTFKVEHEQNQSIEYWIGGNPKPKKRDIEVIQDLEDFISKIANEVNDDKFVEKGLGLALSWYQDSLSSDMDSVQFIFLCTALETLNYKHNKDVTNRVLPRQNYRRIREKILRAFDNILQEEKQLISSDKNISQKEKEKIISQVDIFNKILVKPLDDGDYNKIGNLRTSLKIMLDSYKVKYDDLFPNLEFIAARDGLIHSGYGGLDVEPGVYFTPKLKSLFIRTILSMLGYQGNYMEMEKLELEKQPKYNMYRLVCKRFPLS